ncbi:MAG TPA: Hsp20/alpha crystallin family protein [Dehalococcoidia bacterium]|nr:Hsp20/alpha crystallin family protein [Dehalococcoidia bacterium]
MAKENGNKVAVQRKKAGELMAWPEEMERFFDRAMRGFGEWPGRRLMHRHFFPFYQRAERWVPEVDILEQNGALVVKVDLPGMKREDIEVGVEGDMLVIRGRRAEEKEIKEENYYCAERASGEFYRAFTLPEGVDAGTIQATYEDGVLEVKMPRPAAAEPKKLKVEVK